MRYQRPVKVSRSRLNKPPALGCDATVRVLEATGVKFDWDTFVLGEAAIEKFGTPLLTPK